MKTNKAMRSRIALGWVLACVFLMLSGCKSTSKTTKTGFLGDYSELAPSSSYPNTDVFISPDFNRDLLAKINKVHIQDFHLLLPKQSASLIGSSQLQDVVVYFSETLKNRLADDYQIVDGAATDVLSIRGALTNININEPEMSITDVLPFRVVINAGNAAYLEATGQQDLITQVGLEAEFTMGELNRRVFAMSAIKKLDTTVDEGAEGNVQAVKQVIDTWINNFVSALKDIRQR